jgi:hypothetical protein
MQEIFFSKRWFLTTGSHGVTFKNTIVLIIPEVQFSDRESKEKTPEYETGVPVIEMRCDNYCQLKYGQ